MGIIGNSPSIVDLGTSREDLLSYYRQSGYWGTEELARRYACDLSPCAFLLSGSRQEELERLGQHTYAAVQQLNVRLCQIAGSSHIPPRDGHFLRIANAATRGLLRPLDQETAIPPAIKVDMVLGDEGFRIAEVDVYNPRGYGFSAFLEGSVPESLRGARYPGVSLLSELLKEKGGREWYAVVSHHERFYRETFAILARALAPHGIRMGVVDEEALALGRTQIPEGTGVLAIPASLNLHPKVRTELLERRAAGEIALFYPPVAYLESKAFLPYLRTCEGMEEFVPRTHLIGRSIETPDMTGPLVLKAAVSSGLKGVVFSELDPIEFSEGVEHARTMRTPSWILQEQVPQQPVPLTVFDKSGERVVRDYYLRFIAYVTAQGIIDVEITARPDPKVHGAPDCVQIPTVFA